MNRLPVRRHLVGTAACAVLAVAPRAGGAQGDDVLGRAMRDELARSMKELRLGQFERPYFIAYRVREMEVVDASAVHGSLLEGGQQRIRGLAVDVRVGDYAFDNTNFFGHSDFMMVAASSGALGFATRELPLDDNYRELRRKLWLATDADYKQALETIAAKRAARLNRARGDSLADFTREAPTRTADDGRPATFSRADAESLARELSRVGELTRLHSSQVGVNATNLRVRFVNSEGTAFVRSRSLVSVSASGSTQAADGQPIAGSIRFLARSLDALPPRDALLRAVTALAAQLDSLRTAPVQERYNGPVLFVGKAAAELFAETFAPALVGRRPMASGEQELARMFERAGASDESFTDKIGRRVLPEFLSIIDDPTISDHRGEPLLGAYTVDDDGVPGRRKTLVESGVLKSVLTTRTPVEGINQSTGNRRGEGGGPSNLVVQAARSLGDAELKAELLALVKRRGLPYGVLVRELGARQTMMLDDPMSMFMAGPGGRGGGRPVLRAYRVYPDGREQLVRGGRLGDVDVQSFRDVVAASSTAVVHHRHVASAGEFPMPAMALAMMEDAGSWEMPVASYVVPSLLFEDVTLLKPPVEQPKPPLSSPPGGGAR